MNNIMRFKLFIICSSYFFSSNISAEDQHSWIVTNLGKSINTIHDEAFPAITDDGLNLYFSRRRIDGDDDDWNIYVSTRQNLTDEWGEPRLLPSHINTSGTEHSVSFSDDGKWLYFSSNQLDTCGGLDIFKSYREDLNDELAWGKPQNLGCDVNTSDHDVCVIYHTEETSNLVHLYFVSNRKGSIGHLDAWRIRFDPKTNKYSEAEILSSINSPKFDGHLDPKSGYVWTSRKGGYGGSDIWHSERDTDGNWQTPVNLGASINTSYDEQLPAPFDNGRIIYFPSDRIGGEGGLDIYIAEKKYQ